MPSDDDRTHAASPRELPSQAPLLSPSLTERLRNGRWWRNLIGEAGAEVFRVQLPTGPDVFLKQADGDDAQALIDEMGRLAWLSRLDAGNLPPVPAIVHAETMGGRSWLLTSAMPAALPTPGCRTIPDVAWPSCSPWLQRCGAGMPYRCTAARSTPTTCCGWPTPVDAWTPD